jgi:hypothetical protein
MVDAMLVEQLLGDQDVAQGLGQQDSVECTPAAGGPGHSTSLEGPVPPSRQIILTIIG